MIVRDVWEIFNGDFMEWDQDATFWPGPAGGSAGARNWFGGPGIGGSVWVGKFGPLTPAQATIAGSRWAIFYSVVTPATQGGDGTPTGWMTIIEAESDGGQMADIVTPWGASRWGGQTIRLSAGFSTNMPVSARLVAWAGDVQPFTGVVAGPETLVQPMGWVRLEAELAMPVQQGVDGNFPYVGVGLDIRAGYAGTLGVTGWRVKPVV